MHPTTPSNQRNDGGEWRVFTRLARFVSTGLIAAVVVVSGCRSCERAPETPGPAVKEGHLPRAPEAVVTPRASVPPPACAVVADASTEEGAAPLTVQFSSEGMCTDATGSLSWNFGDGSAPSHEQNPTHVYTKPGTYTASVTLADDEHAARDTDEATVIVTAP
jgi:hypothetical protein